MIKRITRDYKGLQRVSGGVEELQGYKRFKEFKGLQGLQEVERRYRRLQGVTGGYKWLKE